MMSFDNICWTWAISSFRTAGFWREVAAASGGSAPTSNLTSGRSACGGV